MNVVRVPKSYLPEGVYFLVAHKDAVLMPYKIADAKVHEDPVGVSGALIEGRHYYDAYVLGAKCGGVYALVATGLVSAKARSFPAARSPVSAASATRSMVRTRVTPIPRRHYAAGTSLTGRDRLQDPCGHDRERQVPVRCCGGLSRL